MFRRYGRRIGSVLKEKGFIAFFGRIVLYIFSIPVASIIVLISPLIKIRFITLYTSRIGEYAVIAQMLLQAMQSNEYVDEKNCKHFFYAQLNHPISNKFFHKMLSRKIRILPCAIFWSYVDRILISILGKKYNTQFKQVFQRASSGEVLLRSFAKPRTQILSFLETEKIAADALMRQLGIAYAQPFVCLLVRDSKYLQVHMPNTNDWKYHIYRNADITNFIPAIEFLTNQGFYVLRMGKYTESELHLSNPKFIDYANHTLRSDFMDIYLSAHCAFFLSTGTGIDVIAQIFNKPVLMSNYILCDMQSCFNPSFMIPKNVMCTETETLIPYCKLFDDYRHFFLSGKFIGQDSRRLMFAVWEKKNWVFVENSADEILTFVKETVDFLLSARVETDEAKKTQQLFWGAYPAFSDDILSKYITMRISPAFLKMHSNLLVKKLLEQQVEIC